MTEQQIWGEVASIDVSRYSTAMLGILPVGHLGSCTLAHDTMPRGSLIHTYDPAAGRIRIGKLSKELRMVVLREGPDVWMSDTPLEQEGLRRAVEGAHGNVLTAGLGIGLFPMLIRAKEDVKTITVVESSRDIAGLVWRHIAAPGMMLVIDDVWRYLRTTAFKYDYVYLDPWDDWLGPIKQADLALLAAARVLRPGGEARVWLQELCENIKGALPSGPIAPGAPGPGKPPCLICGKVFRYDYAGLCADCADSLEVSELFSGV